MKLLAPSVGAGALTLLALSLTVSAQRTSSYSSQQSSSMPADFVEGNLRFHSIAAGFMQVIDTTNNQNAGTVIFPPGGAPVFAPMPGYDINAAWDKHQSSASATVPPVSPTASGPTAAPTTSLAASTSGFNPATKTATLADGRSVTFIDKDNAEVTVLGMAGAQTYHLKYHGSSGMNFARSVAMAHAGGVGESFGSGVTITLAAGSGMPGAQLYDTANGSVVPPSVIARLKPIVDAVADAVQTARPADPKLADTRVIHSILHNNLYRAPGY